MWSGASDHISFVRSLRVRNDRREKERFSVRLPCQVRFGSPSKPNEFSGNRRDRFVFPLTKVTMILFSTRHLVPTKHPCRRRSRLKGTETPVALKPKGLLLIPRTPEWDFTILGNSRSYQIYSSLPRVPPRLDPTT